MRFIANANGCALVDGTHERYRKIAQVEMLGTQFSSFVVELTRYSYPCAFAVPHSVLPYVEAILPKFERTRMVDEVR